MLHIKHRFCAALLGACALAGAGTAAAQSYPAKPIQIVVPFPAGGPNDILARAIGQEMAASLKQPVVIDNRAGATGNIGAQAVARSAPDGHTLLITLDSSITANPTIYGKRMGFDAERDLRPIAMLATFNQMLVVNPTAEVANFNQFVEAAKKGLNYASAGNASPGHLTMEALQSLIGSQLNHIPYRGNAPAVIDLLGGQVHTGFIATPAVLQHVASGKLTALAVSGSKRSALAPTVPTIAELGLPEATSEFGYVLLAPAKTPEAIVQLLNAEVRKALASDAVRARLRVLDIEPAVGSPQQAATVLKAGTQKWAKVIQERKIQAD